MFSYGLTGFMFNFLPFIVFIIFIVVIGTFVISALRGVSEWNSNNNSPLLIVNAKVIAKRTDVKRHSHNHAGETSMNHTTYSSSYYVTFEVESGSRMEFLVPGKEFGLLIEGDAGSLSFQGTRFKGFERKL